MAADCFLKDYAFSETVPEEFVDTYLATLDAIDHHFGTAQFLENTITERGSSHATTGDGKDYHQLFGLAGAGHFVKAVPDTADLIQLWSGGPVGAAGREKRSSDS